MVSGSIAFSFFFILLFQTIFHFGLLSVTFRLSFRTSKRQKYLTAVVNQKDLPANRFNEDAILCHFTNMEPFVRGR